MRKKLDELSNEKGDDDQQNINTRVQHLEITMEESQQQIVTRWEKMCEQFEMDLKQILQESIQEISKEQKEFCIEMFSQFKNSVLKKTTCYKDTHLKQMKLVGKIADNHDAQENRRERQENAGFYNGTTVQQLYEGMLTLQEFCFCALHATILSRRYIFKNQDLQISSERRRQSKNRFLSSFAHK